MEKNKLVLFILLATFSFTAQEEIFALGEYQSKARGSIDFMTEKVISAPELMEPMTLQRGFKMPTGVY